MPLECMKSMPTFGNWYLATFWLVLVRLANIMAILLGLLALLKVISWTFGLVLRCVAVREVLGCGPIRACQGPEAIAA